MAGKVSTTGNLGNELAQARVLRDVLSERQIEAVMTAFWFNHFNVFIGKESDRWYTASYERDVIRAHALGSFRDLLLATAQSPAMMVYLDNLQSVGPDSAANGGNAAIPRGKRGAKGLNENYGREVMELHTLGVDGSYTQTDVTALFAILTGWGVDRPGQGGPFLYESRRHEPGPKVWLGHTLGDDGSTTLADGRRSPAAMAADASTALGVLTSPVVDNDSATTRAVGNHPPAPPSRTHVMAVTAAESEVPAPSVLPSPALPAGTQWALHILEDTLLNAPVSARTDALIETQVAGEIAAQPATANPSDMLALAAGLLLGSPEFQRR